MTTFTSSSGLFKDGIILLSSVTEQAQRFIAPDPLNPPDCVIIFQYNPMLFTSKLDAQATGKDSARVDPNGGGPASVRSGERSKLTEARR